MDERLAAAKEGAWRQVAAIVAGRGFAIAGRAERPRAQPRLAYEAFWIDS